MTSMPRRLPWFLLLASCLALCACSSSHLDPPEVQGDPLMVAEGKQPRLWVLTKQEEAKQVGVGSRRRTEWRTDTFFHFRLEAFDPVTARPLWKTTLMTLGDADARGTGPSRVIGSSVDARLLGQDGNLVWLLIGTAPFAVDVADGRLVADAAALEQRNPELKGLLPSESRHYRFERGLVFMAADARAFVVRGPQLQASEYVAPPPPAPIVPSTEAARRLTVPMRPLFGDVPARQVLLDGRRIGLYSAREAAAAANDEWGDKLRYPYSIDDEGTTARRTFWQVRTATVEKFEDRFERIEALDPVAGSPTYLKGRFLKLVGTDDALVLDAPAGVLVWHSTRVDSAGRIALSRVDATLKPLWTTELPLSESGTINPLPYWLLPDRVVAMGRMQTEVDGVTSWEPHLVSVAFADGARQAWNMKREAAVGAAVGD